MDKETEAQRFWAQLGWCRPFFFFFFLFSFCLQPLGAGKFFLVSSLDGLDCFLWSDNACLLLPFPAAAAPQALGRMELG